MSAVTAAVLAVLAALGSLLSRHAANDAILGQTLATDQWSYYQAVNTRSHIYEVNAELLDSLTPVERQAQTKPKVEALIAKPKEYEKKKTRSRRKPSI